MIACYLRTNLFSAAPKGLSHSFNLIWASSGYLDHFLLVEREG
jgi:hypothetical protein